MNRHENNETQGQEGLAYAPFPIRTQGQLKFIRILAELRAKDIRRRYASISRGVEKVMDISINECANLLLSAPPDLILSC